MRMLVLSITVVFCSVSVFAQRDSFGLAWPPFPEQPRIKYLRTISSPEGYEHETGFFSKLFGSLFGEGPPPQWLIQPVTIKVSPKKRLCIADPGAHSVYFINLEKEEYDVLSGTKFENFLSPVGIAFAPDGTMYISDSENRDITALDEDHDAKFQIKEHLVRPTGLLVLDDRLYVADAGRHCIVIFDLRGKYISEFGNRGSGDGSFNFPIDLAGRNVLHVVDALNYRVQTFSLDGKFISAFGGQGTAPGSFASPKSIALDSDTNIYVTDALMDNFQIFNRGGQLLLSVGKAGTAEGQFMSPGGITIDTKDDIYVLDMLNRRIQVFTYLKVK